MAEWVGALPAFAVAFVVMVAAGLPAAYLIGLRGVVAWGTAPLFAGFGVGVAATVSGEAGVRWGVGPYLAGVVLTVVLALAGRLAAGRWRSPHRLSRPSQPWLGRLVVGALVVVALVELRRQMLAIGEPSNISQTFDNIFHLNSVTKILDTGNASTFSLDVMAPGTSAFYPALWHQVVALVASVTGATVPVAANAVTLAISTVVWPLALLAFARTVFGPRPLLLAAVAVLPFSLVQFPLLMMSFGVLYPNLYSYALLPGLLALVVLTVRYARGRRRLAPFLAAGAGSVTLVVAQPNGLIAAMVVAIPLLVWVVARSSRRALRAGRPLRAVAVWVVSVALAVGVYVALGTIPLLASFRDGSEHWGPVGGGRSAIWQLVTLAAGRSTELPQFQLAVPLAIGLPQYVVAALVVVGGVAALLVARWRWLAFSYLALGVLFVTAQAVRHVGLRAVLTGYWYSDAVRLAALLPVLGIPLAALGAATVAMLVRRAWLLVSRPAAVARRPRPQGRPALAAVTVSAVVVLGALSAVVLPRTSAVESAYGALTQMYSVDPVAADSLELVSAQELRIFDVVARTVPEGTSVAGDPWDGSAMVRTFADRVAVFPNPRRVSGADAALVQTRLNQALTDPSVCDAVHRLHLGYVTRFGRHLWGGGAGGFEGLDHLTESGVGELVAQYGEARLYRITACS